MLLWTAETDASLCKIVPWTLAFLPVGLGDYDDFILSMGMLSSI